MNLTQITGYRTNEDYSQTLAWTIREADGLVECVHTAPECCARCVKADRRLFRNYDGQVVARFNSWDAVDGRTVTRNG